MRLRFHKYHGLGNDFIVLDARSGTGDADGLALAGPLARALCDRHFGIGADGLLVWTGSVHAPRMTVINADGSVPEMCGNGLRCFVKHLLDGYLPDAAGVTVDTDAGRLACTVFRAESGAVRAVTVAMGLPRFEPDAVPVTADAPLIDAHITVAGMTLQVTAVGTGNPHLVTFEPLEAALRLALAPQLAALPWLPRSANVEFARLLPAAQDGSPLWELDVFERGCGWTLACGTGAVATVAAAVKTGRAAAGVPVHVRLPGGWLEITVDAAGMATMTGPAVAVHHGAVDLAAVEPVGRSGP